MSRWHTGRRGTGLFFSAILSLYIAFSALAGAAPPQASESRAPAAAPQRVGLVLSGGGAKGFAHIGALKLLDSLHVPVDAIAGTSIGAIIGALYAVGYSAKELEHMALTLDWRAIFTDTPPRRTLPYFQKKDTGRYQLEFGLKGLKPLPPSGLIRGQKVLLLLSRLTFAYEHVDDFDALPIPFRCVAVDLVSGNEVVLRRGSLARALRASMSIPTVFSPVDWGDSLLIDGGLLNNLPVDVAREMGADYIIAVNVGSPLKDRKDLQSLLDVLEQSINIPAYPREKANIEDANLLISPDLTGFTAADFATNKIAGMIRRGYQAAQQKLPELIRLQQRITPAQEMIAAGEENTGLPQQIFGVTISGNTTLPFDYLHRMLKIAPGDTFNADSLNQRFAGMYGSGLIEHIDFEKRPVSDRYVKLFIRIKEKQAPLIHGISIEGNRRVPFGFIYRLLGYKPGDRFDLDKLEQRITDLYSLGYFETVHYEIEPVSEHKIRLILRVKEREVGALRFGLRYDDFHQAVAALSMQGTNILVPGLRMENELQFAGLTRFRFKAFYPSRTLDLPAYPFIRIAYKSLPINIFETTGQKIASYQDRSWTAGMGIGFLFGKSWNLEAEYNYEAMNIEPEIAFPDAEIFPIWRDELRKVQVTANFDVLDDVLLPRRGYRIRAEFEGSFRKLGSQLEYKRTEVSADFYASVGRRHTARLLAYWSRGSWDLPLYKYFYLGGPETFVGLDYHQLAGNRINLMRFDYRYEYRENLFFKLIVNTAFNYSYDAAPQPLQVKQIWGYGVAVKYLSPFGPLEMTFARGEKGIFAPGPQRNIVYFTAGYKF